VESQILDNFLADFYFHFGIETCILGKIPPYVIWDTGSRHHHLQGGGEHDRTSFHRFILPGFERNVPSDNPVIFLLNSMTVKNQ
jgi:hypothetical protein